MIDTHPSNFSTDLTNNRLEIISNALLEQCYETDDNLQSEYDDGYSVGCTRFARQKNRLIAMASEYEWLGVIDSSNSLVMTIVNTPFRFTSDDYLFPRKKTALQLSEKEAAHISNTQIEINLGDPNFDINTPVKWRFYIDVTKNIEDDLHEYEIYFIGLNHIDTPVCIWCLSDHSSLISSVDNYKPEPVVLPQAKTTLPQSEHTPVKTSDKKS